MIPHAACRLLILDCGSLRALRYLKARHETTYRSNRIEVQGARVCTPMTKAC